MTPLEHYLGKGLAARSNHGIVGLAYLPDGRLLFTTHRGQLYVVEPKGAQPAKVDRRRLVSPGRRSPMHRRSSRLAAIGSSPA